jgi:hypothetical protein
MNKGHFHVCMYDCTRCELEISCNLCSRSKKKNYAARKIYTLFQNLHSQAFQTLPPSLSPTQHVPNILVNALFSALVTVKLYTLFTLIHMREYVQ